MQWEMVVDSLGEFLQHFSKRLVLIDMWKILPVLLIMWALGRRRLRHCRCYASSLSSTGELEKEQDDERGPKAVSLQYGIMLHALERWV